MESIKKQLEKLLNGDYGVLLNDNKLIIEEKWKKVAEKDRKLAIREILK